MSTMFGSVEEAKAVVASIVGVDPASFKEDPSLRVGGIRASLLDDPDTPEEKRQSIQAWIDSQKGFKTTKNGKEIQIVICPFRSGFDCWFIDQNGFCIRI